MIYPGTHSVYDILPLYVKASASLMLKNMTWMLILLYMWPEYGDFLFVLPPVVC